MRTVAVAICWGGGCLPQCMLGYTPPGLGLDTPRAWAWTPPPLAWAWTTPKLPLGLGLDTLLARPPNLPPGPGPRHPPCGQNDRHM